MSAINEEIKGRLNNIISERTTKIIPSNIKSGVTILGVQGNYGNEIATNSFNELNVDGIISTEGKTLEDVPNSIKTVVEKYKSYIPTGESEDGICSNAIPLNASAEIDGNSKQESTTGKNLMKLEEQTLNGITSKIINGKLQITGTATSDFSLVITNDLVLNGTYAFSCNGNKNSAIWFWNRTTSTTDVTLFNNSTTKVYNTDNTLICRMSIIMGRTYNELLEPMIEQGSTATDFEPYTHGASPNPDYPQKVEVVDNGWNLFDSKTLIQADLLDDNGTVINYGSSNHICSEIYYEVKSNTNYIMSINKSPFHLKAMEYDKNKGFIKKDGIFNSQELKFTTSSNTKYVRLGAYDGNGVSKEGALIQLAEGTTSLPYLPYGSIGLRQKRKNLFDKDNSSVTASGITSILNNNHFSYNGTATAQYQNATPTTELELPKGTYTLSITNQLDLPFQIRFQKTKVYNEGGQNVGISKGKTSVTFTTNDDYYYAYLILVTTIGTTYSGETDIQIEEGSTSTSYEPYHSPIIHEIPLNGNTLAKVGDVKDLLTVSEKGVVSLEKKIGKFDLKNIVGISGGGTIGTDFRHHFAVSAQNMLAPKGSSNAISNAFIYKYNNIGELGYFYLSATYGVFADKNGIYSSHTDFYNAIKEYYILYELATPQTIELPTIEPIRLFEGYNKFELITNLDTDFTIKYYKKQ